jgi:hypothetical protein
MMQILFTITLTLSTLLLGCNSSANDFDIFCNYVSKAEKEQRFTPRNLVKSFDIFEAHIKSSNTYGQALKDTWSGVSIMDPKEKYNIFQEIAGSTLNQKWSCPALKRFYATTKD